MPAISGSLWLMFVKRARGRGGYSSPVRRVASSRRQLAPATEEPMSAIADFTVAVLDCQACRGLFIESYAILATQARRIVCPHCGVDYLPEAYSEATVEQSSDAHAPRPARRRMPDMQMSGSRRRKLQ
jgi:hypothetical protein